MIIADGPFEPQRVFVDDVEVSREFIEGGQAFHALTARSDCPYLLLRRGADRIDPDEAKAEDWLRGWDYAWRLDMAARRERWTKLPKFPPFGSVGATSQP